MALSESSRQPASAINMRVTLALFCLLAAGLLVRFFLEPAKPVTAITGVNSAPDVSPVCPWRDPQHDLPLLFPPATNYVLETRILSDLTTPIRTRLGRQMRPDENPLRIFRVSDSGATGSVLVTRVKGGHGAIEIVIGVTPGGTVQRVLIQSQREPEDVAGIITNAAFLNSLAGKNSTSSFTRAEALPALPEAARVSAQAIAAGVRDQLIVLSFAEQQHVTATGAQTRH